MSRIPAFSRLASAALLFGAFLACEDSTGPDDDQRYEVWVVDQANSTGLAYGGTVHIFPDSVLDPASAVPVSSTTIDLGAATASMCFTSTGVQPVRPHGVTFNAAGTHAVVAFVGSGHVAVLNAATRVPIACLRMIAGAAGLQAHQAVVSPDQTMILVANQNGKRLERIDANFSGNTFALNAAAALDLAACTTPSGAACQSTATRPDNAPILIEFNAQSDLAFVTLRGGGMFAVNPRNTPMSIRAEYDSATLKASGLMPLRAGSSLFVSAGTNVFRLYRLPLGSFSSITATAPNTPAPTVITSTVLTGSDAHGMAAVGSSNFIWLADRGLNRIDIFDPAGTARVGSIEMAGTVSSDAAPDFLAVAPRDDRVFVALKGPNALTGGALGTGSTPGVGLIRVDQNGRSGSFLRVVPISTRDAGGVERSDPHGIALRLR